MNRKEEEQAFWEVNPNQSSSIHPCIVPEGLPDSLPRGFLGLGTLLESSPGSSSILGGYLVVVRSKE